MSAPSSSRIVSLLVALVAALAAAGCTVPGSDRFEGPPADLPTALRYVTADVLGFTLYDTDPGSERWAALAGVAGEGDGNRALQALHAPLVGGMPAQLDEVEAWVGDQAGVALRELDMGRPLDTAALYFAEVRDRDALEAWLQEQGWREQETELGGELGDPLTLWTNEWDCADTPRLGTAAGVCAAPPYRAYEAVAVGDDAVLGARTRDGLESLIRSAEAYAVPERRAMRELAVTASSRVPLAFVFRFDLIRFQVRRPFEHDPALLELARWATDSNVLIALRDGWLGLAPPLDGREHEVRLVGSSEWVPSLAPGIELEAATRGRLGQLPADVDVAVAMHDPGQHLRELVRAITIGAGQYVTEQDVADEDERVELLPVLDALDGQAAIGWDAERRRLTMNVATTADAAEVARDASAAIEHADLHGEAVPAGDGVLVTIDLPGGAGAPADRGEAARSLELDLLDGAGEPPSEPIAWLWGRGEQTCIGDRAGWMTFDGRDRLTFDVAVRLAPATPAAGGSLADRGCDPLVQLATIA